MDRKMNMPVRPDLPPPGAAPPPLGAIPIEAELPLNPDDYPLVREFVAEAVGHLESAEAHLLRLEASPHDADAVNAVFRSFHTIKGVAGFLNLRQIGALAHAAENLLDLARQGGVEFRGDVADAALEAVDLMKALVVAVGEAVRMQSTPPPHPALPQFVRRLEALASGRQTACDGEGLFVDRRRCERRQHDRRQADSPADATVKIPVERFDDLINTVGEVLALQGRLCHELSSAAATNQILAFHLDHLGRVSRDLQDLVITMRRVPIQHTFQKMARLVRDLARKSGKQVDLVASGGETELDRHVAEALADPLLHMVRNAVDHGIEPAAARERAGKPRCGRIELRATREADSVVIEISDDGRGLDRGRILAKAVERGIVPTGKDLGEQEVFRLIFHPGLSTAETVTDVSGRGVGMDVVKRNIEALRGRIDILSKEGAGTTFVIRLPLPPALPRALITMARRHGREKGAA